MEDGQKILGLRVRTVWAIILVASVVSAAILMGSWLPGVEGLVVRGRGRWAERWRTVPDEPIGCMRATFPEMSFDDVQMIIAFRESACDGLYQAALAQEIPCEVLPGDGVEHVVSHGRYKDTTFTLSSDKQYRICAFKQRGDRYIGWGFDVNQ